MKKLMDDLTGRTFGKFKVISRGTDYVVPCNGARRRTWNCVCFCGREQLLSDAALRNHLSKSCVVCSKIKHGISRSKLYRCLQAARQRCLNPNNPNYLNYGARGIRFFPEFSGSVREAAAWAKDHLGQPMGSLSLERIDNNDHYATHNLKWGTRSEQSANQRRWLEGAKW